jgi:polyhydroxyalkanoate synthase
MRPTPSSALRDSAPASPRTANPPPKTHRPRSAERSAPSATPGNCGPAGPAQGNALDRAAHAAWAALTGGLSPASMALAGLDWCAHLAVAPGKCLDLALQAWPGAAGGAPPAAGASPTQALAADPRFSAPQWAQWPYRLYRDAFLRSEAWWRDATTGVPGVDPHHEALAGFVARQWMDACSPGNFIATNPLVIEAAWRSGGLNFVAGLQHWADDLLDAGARLRGERPPRATLWRPGRDVAITPGKVVWRNALCELLQYEPATPQVAREPVLIVPSWIMKYYILDLQPHDSLIRYLVDAGFTVFAISWHNPGADERDLGLDDYLRQGFFEPLAQVRARCDAPVHAVGYCLGGTLLAIGAAALARDGRASRLHTLSLLAAQTDFSEPGELGLFIDASELSALDALMWRQGYLDGAQMAAAFQLLNARDLIWSRMMSEYLLGRRSKPSDLMAWNADTTRMPYRMHSEYLTRLFLRNDLAEGRYCVDGRPVALGDIDMPAFVVGTERDHVSPWRSVYKLHLFTHNPLTFVLTSGGHNAGIVSEPGHAGRHYRCATREQGESYRSPDEFVGRAAVTEGSWWPCWSTWLHGHSSAQHAARVPGEALADAPGDYVLEP